MYQRVYFRQEARRFTVKAITLPEAMQEALRQDRPAEHHSEPPVHRKRPAIVSLVERKTAQAVRAAP